MSKPILILNGPNLNLLGTREPHIYGATTLKQVEEMCRARAEKRGLTHTSVVLRDALSGVALPVAEVHISDVMKREPFRHHSYVSDVAIVHVIGEGVQGYATAVARLIDVIAGQAEG